MTELGQIGLLIIKRISLSVERMILLKAEQLHVVNMHVRDTLKIRGLGVVENKRMKQRFSREGK